MTRWRCEWCGTLHGTHAEECRECGYSVLEPVSEEDREEVGGDGETRTSGGSPEAEEQDGDGQEDTEQDTEGRDDGGGLVAWLRTLI